MLEHAADHRLMGLGELLVGELERLVAEAEEVGVPGGVVRGELADEEVDGAEREHRLARAGRRASPASRCQACVCTALHSDTAWRTLSWRVMRT